MAKVICTLPNASDSINGVKFHPLPDGAGRISDEIPDDVAASFTEIAGYELDGEPHDPDTASVTSEKKADSGATATVVPPAADKPAAAPAKAATASAKPATATAKRGAKTPAAPAPDAPATPVEPTAPSAPAADAAPDAPAGSGAGSDDDETIF